MVRFCRCAPDGPATPAPVASPAAPKALEASAPEVCDSSVGTAALLLVGVGRGFLLLQPVATSETLSPAIRMRTVLFIALLQLPLPGHGSRFITILCPKPHLRPPARRR